MMIDQSRTINSQKGQDMARTTKAADEATEVITEEITFSAKELAVQAGTDPKTFRRFLRSKFPRTVKGERWLINEAARLEILAAWELRSVDPEAPESE